MDHQHILLNLFLGSEIEGGVSNLYLRRHDPALTCTPLLGPGSPATFSFHARGFTACGVWQGLRFTASLVLATTAAAWLWQITLENTTEMAVTADLVYAQDIALAPYASVRLNEYYVSHYIDHTPLRHPQRGVVLTMRQNLPVEGRHPWALIGSFGQGVSFTTDALQFYGLARRSGAAPVALTQPHLPGKRHQHEHAMAVLQDAALHLAPHAVARRGFFGWFETHHPAATTASDLAFVDKVMALPEAIAVAAPPVEAAGLPAPATLFSQSPLLTAHDLSAAEISTLFGNDWRASEREADVLLSFFTATHRHVVLKAKELRVLRAHGHIIRTGNALIPDEASLTSTVWMAGVFHSMVTQGHVSINRLLSTSRSYMSLLRAHGQRIFVELKNGYALLDVPSAYEMTPQGCRWIYKHDDGLLEVRSWAALEQHALHLRLDVLAGPPCRFCLAHHIALHGDDGAEAIPVQYEQDQGGLVLRPSPTSEIGRRFPAGSFRIDPGLHTVFEQVGGDELLFVDGQSRQQPYLTIITGKASAAHLRITGQLLDTPAIVSAMTDCHHEMALEQGKSARFWQARTGIRQLSLPAHHPQADAVAHVQEILPWFAHNAMIHYLAPRGLEQYSGGGWGTRDVTQGPFEMLLALRQWQPLRQLLLQVFKAQNATGDWPQWFMFFERERHIRAEDAHGDIVFWPLLALAEYVLATEDASLLSEVVPFWHSHDSQAQPEQATLWEHVERALQVIASRMIPETHLAAYGHGDWNDSLQPADPSMRQRLCSAWTVTLHYQTLSTLARAMRQVGRPELAAHFAASAAQIRADLQRLLIVDGTLCGFAYFPADGGMEPWLHPRDQNTGIHYRLLPMIHAIIHDMFSPAQARQHIGLIQQHLLGPDGARLFDRPPRYQGGPQTYFQRAESSAFFGREIGLMYMHAHLRYAQAMARYGAAEAFFLALCQANPIALRTLVPAAALRQANCYYSSSDAAFADRYEALASYHRVHTGDISLQGGWRLYSSGAGIFIRLLHQCFLGLRPTKSLCTIDPVLPASLHGLRAEVELADRQVQVIYHIGPAGYGPTSLVLNGKPLAFLRDANPYRIGGAVVSMPALCEQLTSGPNELIISLR